MPAESKLAASENGESDGWRELFTMYKLLHSDFVFGKLSMITREWGQQQEKGASTAAPQVLQSLRSRCSIPEQPRSASRGLSRRHSLSLQLQAVRAQATPSCHKAP